MSWGTFGGLYLGYRGGAAYWQAAEAAKEAGRGKSAARRAMEVARVTEERLAKLTLVCAAMWTLLRDRTELTEEDLAQAVRELDLKDGVEDGKVTQTIVKCPKCGRTMHPRHHRCLYCGTEGLKETAFDGV
jgi:ribosomal protein S27AE